MRNHRLLLSCIFCFSSALFATGCTWSRTDDQRTREEKTRDEVARATERAKPALEDAGRKIGKAAAAAADEAQAAAEGVREGWTREHGLINVNAASESELATLPGLSHRDARRIIDGRPYSDRHDVVVKGILSESSYQRIRDQITSK